MTETAAREYLLRLMILMICNFNTEMERMGQWRWLYCSETDTEAETKKNTQRGDLEYDP